MPAFFCPALDAFVELSLEREERIVFRHPELQPRLLELVENTLSDPDLVDRRSDRPEMGLVRYWPDVNDGRFVAVVVRGDHDRGASALRYWVVTVYTSRKIDTWKSLWERS